jgi:hypothetical protein
MVKNALHDPDRGVVSYLVIPEKNGLRFMNKLDTLIYPDITLALAYKACRT